MPVLEAGWGIEATMGQFFPAEVFCETGVDDYHEFTREFYQDHAALLLHPTNLLNRLTLQVGRDTQLQVERHQNSEAFPRTISLGFIVKDEGKQLGWIISNRANQYRMSLVQGESTAALYVRNNQNSLLRRKELSDAAAQCAVLKAAVFLASHPETRAVIDGLKAASAQSKVQIDAIKRKQAANTPLTTPERDALKADTPHGFPIGPWTDMTGKTPLIADR